MQKEENNYTNIVVYPDSSYELGVNRLYDIYPEDVKRKEDVVNTLVDIKNMLLTGYPYRIKLNGISNSIVKRILEIIKNSNVTVDIYSNQLKPIDYAIGLKGMTITINSVEEYEKIRNVPKKFILATYPEILEEVYKDVKQRKNIDGIKLISKNLIDVTPEMIQEYEPNLIGLLNSSGFVSFRDLYTPKDFLKIQSKALTIIQKLFNYKRRISRLEAFLFIYNELGEKIEYDKNLLREEKYSGMYNHNLLALLNNASACEGIAKSLTEVLCILGIESVVVIGHTMEASDTHAWNKVKIGGNWYNCDLAYDGYLIREGGKPKRCLLTNDEFENLGYIESGYKDFETPKENYDQEEVKRFFEEDHNEVSKEIKTMVDLPEELAKQIESIRDFYQKPIFISLSKTDNKYYAMKFKRKLKDGAFKNISTETPMLEVEKRGEFLAEFQKIIGIKKAKKGCIIGDGVILRASREKKKEKIELEEIR